MRCLPLADDCGVSAGITGAILRCLDAGSLLGTSLLAGGPDAENAAAALRARLYGDVSGLGANIHGAGENAHGAGVKSGPRPAAPFPVPAGAGPLAASFSVGVHLNLLEGPAVAPAAEIPLLADEKGLFRHSLASLLALCHVSSRQKKRALLTQVEREFSAQIERAQTLLAPQTPAESPPFAAPVPLYLDGHLHVHAIPAFLPVLESLLNRYALTRVRVPAEPRFLPPCPLVPAVAGTLRRELLSFWSGPLRALLRRKGVPFTDFFLGSFCSGSMTLPRLRTGLERARSLERGRNRSGGPSGEAMVEIMLHPGGPDAAPPGGTPVHSSGKAPKQPPGGLPGRKTGPALPYTAFYASPARRAEAAMLLSPEFHELMREFDPGWRAPFTTTGTRP